MKDAGVDVENCGSSGISVQGDTTINNSGLRSLGTVAVILLALGTGAGITAFLYGRLSGLANLNNVNIQSPEPVSVENWRLGLQVTDAP